MVQKLEEIGPGTLGWLAGWLEGEGSFLTDKLNRILIRCGCTDEDVVHRAYKIFGGTFGGPYNRGLNSKGENKKLSWTWQLNGIPARELMLVLYPLMGSRRQTQIKTALENHRLEARTASNKNPEYIQRRANTRKANSAEKNMSTVR